MNGWENGPHKGQLPRLGHSVVQQMTVPVTFIPAESPHLHGSSCTILDRVLSYRLSESSVFVVTPINFLPRLSNLTRGSNGDEMPTDDPLGRLQFPLLSLSALSQPLRVSRKLIRRRQASLYISGNDEIHQSSSRVIFSDDIATPGVNLDGNQVLSVRCFPRMDIPGAFLCAIWSTDTLLVRFI